METAGGCWPWSRSRLELLIDRLKTIVSNAEFLAEVAKRRLDRSQR